MFRCPTCIGVLTDPTARRCGLCGQRLRRRRPRVLGEEHRPGAKMLPIERALHERLHGSPGTRGRHARNSPPPPWLEQYKTSTAHAGMVATAPEAATVAVAAPSAPATPPPAPALPVPLVPETPSAPVAGGASALDVTAYLSAFEPAAAATAPADAPPAAHAAPAPTADEPIPPVETGPLDPEVQALVDELYRKAHAEITGTAEPAPTHAPPAQPRRRGWVPAVLSELRRNDSKKRGDAGPKA